MRGLLSDGELLFGSRPVPVAKARRPQGKPHRRQNNLQSWISWPRINRCHSMEYITINTHQGLYQLTRLPLALRRPRPSFRRQCTPSSKVFHIICYMDNLPDHRANRRRASPDSPGLTLTPTPWSAPEVVQVHISTGICGLLGPPHCILWGICLLAPKKLRPTILDMLHEGHTEIVRMKRLTLTQHFRSKVLILFVEHY